MTITAMSFLGHVSRMLGCRVGTCITEGDSAKQFLKYLFSDFTM